MKTKKKGGAARAQGTRRLVIAPPSALSRGTSHSNQVCELILSKKGVRLSDVYTAGGDVLMSTLRRETAERAAHEASETLTRQEQAPRLTKEAELEAPLQAARHKPEADRAEKEALTRFAHSRSDENAERKNRVCVGRGRGEA